MPKQLNQDEIARTAIEHYYLGNLGLSMDQIADARGIDRDRFKIFMDGVSSSVALTPTECAAISEEVLASKEAEDFEVKQAERRMVAPPKTIYDAIQEKVGNQ